MNHEIMGAMVMLLAVLAVYLNNHKHILCFSLFIVSNLMAFCVHYDLDLHSWMLGDTIFLGLAVHGWIKWYKKRD